MVIGKKLKNKLVSGFIALFSIATLVAPGAVNAAGLGGSLCDEISQGTGGFFSCGQDTTTLTDFKGGLTTPDASGYNEGLTKATNLRDYIKNVVNFALSFLGILAVVIIIYGGFLYVTDAGKAEQSEKGKKAITFSIIGILIILGSFAIVNTILQAPTGSDQNLNGSATTPGGISGSDNENINRRALFNYAASAVQTLAREFVTAYQNYSEINIDIQTLLNTEFEKDVNTASDFKSILSNKRTILINIVSKAGALSQISEASKNALVVIDKYISLSDRAVKALAEDEESFKVGDFWGNVKIALGTSYDDMKAEFDKQFGSNGSFVIANQKDFALAVYKTYQRVAELQTLVKSAADVTTVNTLFTTIQSQLQALVPSLNGFISVNPDPKSLQLQAANANNAKILEIVTNLGTLYEQVKDIQFIYTAINSDIIEGNAPLIVNFDALKSRDPNNQTIPALNYTWDFGDSGVANKTCKGTGANPITGPTISNIYCEPGTYIVKLSIKAPEPQANQPRIADGVAYQTIRVRPPSSRIKLSVATSETATDENTVVMSDYNTQGVQIINRSDVNLVTSEAKNGVWFDASASETGQGTELQSLTSNPNVKVKWDFGDKSKQNNTVEGTADTLGTKQKFTYENQGTYRVNLQVTDDKGITDRKIFNILVRSLAARIKMTPSDTTVKLNQEVTFDASPSTSDVGAINSYKFELRDSKGQTPTWFKPNAEKDPVLKVTFPESGDYTLGLTISNGETEDHTEVLLQVRSQPPVSQFTYESPDTAQPNTYILDGTKSYDPDGKTLLEYKWETNSAAGACTFRTFDESAKKFSDTQSDCAELANLGTDGFGSASKLKMKFQKGKHNVTLTVRDPKEGTTGEGKPQEQEIDVQNDLDIAWKDSSDKITMPIASALDETKDNKATVTFRFTSENGVAYELDTGDSNKENGTFNQTTKEVQHTYSQAGVFKIKLTVYDEQDNGNTINGKVFINSAENPIAVISTKVDNEDVVADKIVANRKTAFIFDAAKSLNTDGTARRLIYNWKVIDIKSNVTIEQKNTRQFNYTFKEVGDYRVSLKVTNDEDVTQSSVQDDTIDVSVISQPPVLLGLTAVPTTSKITTPVTVNVAAVGATDPDGQIVSYRWWYYPAESNPTDPENQKGVQITQTPNAILTLGTMGEQGQKQNYRFAVSMKDSDNQESYSYDLLNEGFVPSLEVENGPNKAPVAKFTVDRTTVYVGESVNFSSAAFDQDSDGKIVHYIWDFEGKGFAAAQSLYGAEYDKANVSFTYAKAAKDGVKARLKVVDNNGSEAVSEAITIFVDANAKAPTAAFTSQANGKSVKFTDNSKGDADAGATMAKWNWDFDVNTDSDGDGKKDNDIDSTEQNPQATYPEFGIYRVKLSVEDNYGGKANVTNFVNVKAPTGTAFNQESLKASVLAGYGLVDWSIMLASASSFGIFITSVRAVKRRKSRSEKKD